MLPTSCGAILSRPVLPNSELRLEGGQLLPPGASPQLWERDAGGLSIRGNARWDGAPSIQAAEKYDLLFRPDSRLSVGCACLL